MTCFEKVNVGGICVDVCTGDELASTFIEDLYRSRKNTKKNNRPKTVFSSNGQGVALAYKDNNFHSVMASADIVHADGMSVVFASCLSRMKLPERISTTDFVHTISKKVTRDDDVKYYLLGGTKKDNLKAVHRLRELYPHITIVGARDGYFNNEEYDEIVDEINEVKPDIVWVALGKPKQECFSLRLQQDLNHSVWIKTCGGLFDFLSGKYRRAPVLMQRLGLEWLYRLSQSPKRLFFRYLTTNVVAIWCFISKTR